MIGRRAFVTGAAAGLLLPPLVAYAQRPATVPRIGVLASLPGVVNWDVFRNALRDLGYVEGQTLAIEWRWWEAKAERLPGLVAELIRLPVQVIVAAGAPVALAAKRATATIPIVFVNVGGDPVAMGLVQSLARPGGNVTGLTILSLDLTAKHLQLLREAVPGVSRIAVLSNPTNEIHSAYWREVELAGRTLGVKLHRFEAGTSQEIANAFRAMSGERPEALVVFSDPFFMLARTRIAELASQGRLPTMGPWREYPEDGGLMSYGPNITDNWRRAATYVAKILKGAKPADLPVEQPTTFELVVNLKTAKALGVTIPPSVLARADRVIR